MNQSELLAITSNLPKARRKSLVQGAIGFRFASHWLKHWRNIFKAITKRSNRNHVISFDRIFQNARRVDQVREFLHQFIVLTWRSKSPLVLD